MRRLPILWVFAVPAACANPPTQPTVGKPAADSAATAADSQPAANDDAADSAADAAAETATSSACKGPADCPPDKPLCLLGQCAAKTACTSDKQCVSLNLVCDKAGGSCVQCNSQTDCQASEACKANTCVPPAKACKTSKECPEGQICHSQLKACAECEQAGDCGPGQACVDTVCAAAACKAGDAKCADPKTLQTCKPDGSGWQDIACASDQTCEDNQCKPVVCEAKSANCDGNVATLCNANGTAQSTVSDCGAKGQICLGGACLSKTCDPGQAICADTKTLAKCKADGSAMEKTPCPADQGCANAQCLPKICGPGTDSCNGSKVVHCNPSGTATAVTADCAAQGKACGNGACKDIAAVCAAGSKQCAGNKAQTCKGDGSGWSEVSCEDANPCTADGCKDGACTAANAADGTVCGSGMGCKAGACASLCGNGTVDSGEQCDDKNGNDGDGCSATCQLEPAVSCAALHAKFPILGDGLYSIDADGAGALPGFKAFCDMTTDGGGWALAMRIKDDDKLGYTSLYWTDGSLLNEDAAGSPDPALNSNAKFAAFTSMSGTTVRGCKGSPGAGLCFQQSWNGSKTLQAVFSASFMAGGPSRAKVVAIWGENTGEPNCNQSGLANGIYCCGNVLSAGARFGLVANNEEDCITPDAAFGFGIYGFAGPQTAIQCGAGSVSGFVKVFKNCTQGTLWIR